MRLAPTAGLALVLVTAAPACAQDAEHLRLARDTLVAMRVAENLDAVIGTVMATLKPALTAGDAKAAKDFDEIAPVLSREFAAVKGSMLDEFGMIYAKSFAKSELKELTVFYKTPTGEKMARVTPVLAQQVGAAGQRYGQQAGAQVAERMRDELRKRGNKI